MLVGGYSKKSRGGFRKEGNQSITSNCLSAQKNQRRNTEEQSLSGSSSHPDLPGMFASPTTRLISKNTMALE